MTTLMTEHSLNVFLDEGETLSLGTPVRISLNTGFYSAELSGCVTNVNISRGGIARTQMIEILDFHGSRDLYLQILYDRIPTLPQSLQRDFGILSHLWQNIAHRVARTRR